MRIYDDLLDALAVRKNERIWLSSEIIKLALMCKKEGERFDASELLDTFQDAIGLEGTLLIPTFSFEFSDDGRYDYRLSRSTSGALGNVALKRDDFKRTRHPMHSFAVWGKDAEYLCAMENKHSFGVDSPFEYCRKNNVRQIILGTDYTHAMTFVHYAETMCKVPYRFAKTFSGIYVTENGTEEERTYDYAARRLDVGTTEQFNRIGALLEQKGIAKTINYNGYISRSVMLGDSYDVVCEDILYNQCRNIYDFSISRELLFADYGG